MIKKKQASQLQEKEQERGTRNRDLLRLSLEKKHRNSREASGTAVHTRLMACLII